ncbi:MAG: DNA polymerase III subunit gamma/tau, partial [Dehalococcoidia bacterium]
MSEVLYRKWRPGTLNDLVGQDHISKTLRNAVKSERISHAYLFCGPRGTGKTSTARILAKLINCESLNEGETNDTCSQCEDINLGRSLDLIEIDGASNRRIADIRELSEKIHYSPTSAKKKVYIIDEVHMLTQEAFNALLKTLEEPPPHAVLILATTDVQKLPATIVSRCQRFDFKRIDIESISSKLKLLSESESINIPSDALDLIARKSTGSLRDAENFLEQAIVSFGSEISLDNLREFFNIDDDYVAIQIFNSIIELDLKGALTLVKDFYQDGKEADQILANMISLSRSLILVKSEAISEKDLGESVWESLKLIASKLEMTDLIEIAKILSDSQRQHSITPIFPLEVGVAEIVTVLSANMSVPEIQDLAVNDSSEGTSKPIGINTEKTPSGKPVGNTPSGKPVENIPSGKPVENIPSGKPVGNISSE